MRRIENTLVDGATVTNSTAFRVQASYINVERDTVLDREQRLCKLEVPASLGALKCKNSPLPVQFGLGVTSLQPQMPLFLVLNL